jgi:hypothetical protein
MKRSSFALKGFTLIALLMTTLSGVGGTASATNRATLISGLKFERSRAHLVKLPGIVTAASSTALLINLNGGNQYENPKWLVVSTRQAHEFDPNLSTVGATLGTSSGIVTDPSVDYPDGLAMFIFSATAPASGLQPAKTTSYVASFNVSTGREILITKVDLPSPGTDCDLSGSYTPLATYGQADTLTFNMLTTSCTGPNYNNEISTLRLYNVNIKTGAIIRNVEVGLGGVSIAGKYIVGNVGISGDDCEQNIVDEVTLATTGEFHSCGIIENMNGNISDWQDLPSVMTKSLSDGYVNVHDNEPNSPSPQTFNLSSGAEVTPQVISSGPRSTIAVGGSTVGVIDSTLDSTSGMLTYSLGSWLPGFAISASQSQALDLTVYGVCDNDIWATNSDQSIIINGRSGKVISTSWKYLPIYGSSGWTVVGSRTTANEYLVRGKGTLVSLLGSEA